MKIDTGKPLGNHAVTEARQRPAAVQQQPAAPASDKVEISSFAATLGRATAAMNSAPEINNRARIDEIKQAIKEGRFKVDPEKIADNLIDSVRSMLVIR